MKAYVDTQDEAEDMARPTPVKLLVRAVDVDADYVFIVDSWCKSYREYESVPDPVYDDGQRGVIQSLLSHSKVLVVCDANSPTFILGYVVFEWFGRSEVIHFLYVKHSHRRMGLGTTLLRATGWKYGQPVYATHRTRIMKAVGEDYDVTYNPYLLRCGTYDRLVELSKKGRQNG